MKIQITTMVIIIWMFISLFTSAIVSSEKLCNKDFPISYIFYTKLFCEIENDN